MKNKVSQEDRFKLWYLDNNQFLRTLKYQMIKKYLVIVIGYEYITSWIIKLRYIYIDNNR